MNDDITRLLWGFAGSLALAGLILIGLYYA